jgi:hypothetical protein
VEPAPAPAPAPARLHFPPFEVAMAMALPHGPPDSPVSPLHSQSSLGSALGLGLGVGVGEEADGAEDGDQWGLGALLR